MRAFHEMLFPKYEPQNITIRKFLMLSYRLSNYYPTIFPEEIFTYENFLWARSLFDSRSIKLKMGEKILPCLIPMADMLNHNPHAQVYPCTSLLFIFFSHLFVVDFARQLLSRKRLVLSLHVMQYTPKRTSLSALWSPTKLATTPLLRYIHFRLKLDLN